MVQLGLDEHINILGSKAIVYEKATLEARLRSFNRTAAAHMPRGWWRAYAGDYEAPAVMKRFCTSFYM